MSRSVRFAVSKPRGDRVHTIGPEDVRVVLSRLPEEVTLRLKAVHFQDRGRGVRRLGFVTQGRSEITLCALPPKVSLSRFLVRGQSAIRFGAVPRGQWSWIAVRRFLLYDVLLHELGHLQIVRPMATSVRRRFAMETLAQRFAMNWCRELWASPFEHPDPVHNPPTEAELTDPLPELTALTLRIDADPTNADLYQQLGKWWRTQGEFDQALRAYTRARELEPTDPWVCLYLGNLFWTNDEDAAALECFRCAAQLAPDLAVAYWCQGHVHEAAGEDELAGEQYRRAVEVEPGSRAARKYLARRLARIAEKSAS